MFNQSLNTADLGAEFEPENLYFITLLLDFLISTERSLILKSMSYGNIFWVPSIFLFLVLETDEKKMFLENK